MNRPHAILDHGVFSLSDNLRFDFIEFVSLPDKADSPLLVDPDAAIEGMLLDGTSSNWNGYGTAPSWNSRYMHTER